MDKQIVKSPTEKLAEFSGYSVEQIGVIKSTVAKGTTDTELALFLSICKTVDLNPFLKQVWCYKDSKGNLLVFTGRDGFLTIAQRDKRWNGMLSGTVCKNDQFELNIPDGKVKHIPDVKSRGDIIGAYAIVKPKGCELPTVEWAEFEVYNKGWNVWKTNPKEMIQKVAEAHALRKAFGVSGLQPEYDFIVDNNTVKSIGELPEYNELDELKKKIIDALATYKGEDRQAIQDMCVAKSKTNEFDLTFAKETAKTLGVV